MSSSKPYLAGKLEYLEVTRKKDFWDEDVNPGDTLEYSEFQKPYGMDDDEDDHPQWEWRFPPFKPWPWYPPDIDPGKCTIDPNCEWAGIIGIDEMECGDCYTYTQAHIWYGCHVAPWWAAYGSWSIVSKKMTLGDCQAIFSGPIMMTVCCDEEAVGQFTVEYSGALDCHGRYDTSVTCSDCCEDDGVTLTGADTVDAGDTWVGTISPACDGFDCRVTSNSECIIGCTMNLLGSSVSVSIGAGQCGTFTVTIFDPKGGKCTGSASKSVRINDNGQWSGCGSIGPGDTCNGPWCGGGWQVDADNAHRYEVWCYGGGTCINGDRTLTCSDGWSKYLAQSSWCCNGCQDCVSNYLALGASVQIWECSGSCS